MKKIYPWLIVLLLTSSALAAGSWSPNKFCYKPGLTTQGTTDYTQFNISQDRVDAKLATIATVGDPSSPTFAASVATLNSSGTMATLRLPAGAHTVASDLTVNANIALVPDNGAMITVANGKTLTINGTLSAGLYQIFTCTGTGKVVFGSSINEVYPEWWGATGDGTTDDGAAINAAAAAVRHLVEYPRKATLLLPAGEYATSVPLDLTGCNIDCRGRIYSSVTSTYLTKVGMGKHLNIDLKVRKAGAWDAGSVGILVVGLIESDARVASWGCETGIKIYSDSDSYPTWNNNFRIGEMVENKVALLITLTSTGWVNLNRYYGGYYGCVTSGAEAAVKIVGGSIGIDTQIFYSPDFEYNYGVNGVIFDACSGCVVNDARIESGTDPVVAQFNGYALNNIMRIASTDDNHWHNVDFSTGACNGFGNRVEYVAHNRIKINQTSSTEFAYLVGTRKAVPGFEIWRVNAAMEELGSFINDYALIKPRYKSRVPKIDIPWFSGYALGVKVTFDNQVTPLQRLDLSTIYEGAGLIYDFRVYNSAGTELSGTAPYYVQGHNVSSTGTYYRVSGNGMVFFHKSVKTVYVGIEQALGVKDFSIYGWEGVLNQSTSYSNAVSSAVGYNDSGPLELPGTYYGAASPTLWPFGKGVVVQNLNPASGQPSGWVQILGDRNRTLTVAAVATDTTITVSRADYIDSGDLIYVLLDSGEYHCTTVNGAPAGNVVTLTDAIPTGKTAAIGNSVINNLWKPLANIP